MCEELKAPRGVASAFNNLRAEALALLVWNSALHIAEALALDVKQVIAEMSAAGPVVRDEITLRPEQAIDGVARTVALTGYPKVALAAYAREAARRSWIDAHGLSGPLFVGSKGRAGVRGHERLDQRTAQRDFQAMQRRLRRGNKLRRTKPYTFRDLRRDGRLHYPGTVNDHLAVGYTPWSEEELAHIQAGFAERHRMLEAHYGCKLRSFVLYVGPAPRPPK